MTPLEAAEALIQAWEDYYRRFRADEMATLNGDQPDPQKTGLAADRQDLAQALATFIGAKS